ncbi:MAG TPA: DUF2255 family protein [Microbacteriaceae bacterium]|nr:DUF2255 family protein [Microbacteriaceae bacterium]
MSHAGHDLEYFEHMPIVHIVTTNDAGHEVITPIWAVVTHGRAYIRNAHGPESKWFGRVLRAHAAEFVDGERRIPATAESVMDHEVLDRVDEAYRAKYTYPDSPVEVVVSAAARGDTLLITPQEPRHPATGSSEHV